MRLAFLVPLIAAMVLGRGVSALQDRPLPDPGPFFDAVRQNVARAQGVQNAYAYKERRTDVHTNPFGRIGTGGTRVVEVTPGNDGLTATRRLIERNQVAVSSPAERVNLPRRRVGGGTRGVEDVVQALAFTLVRREIIDGTSFIVVAFEPRPNAKPTTRQGRLARAFTGNMWVDEVAREVARVEATAVQDMSFGLGLVARLRRGAQVTATRQPVEGNIWMPTAIRFAGEGRAMLFRKLDIDYAIDWFDYRLVGSLP